MSNKSNDPTAEVLKCRTEIDHSLRHPLMFFFTSGSVWLAVAVLFGIIASAKVVNPSFLADCACLQYGRVFAVHMNLLIYGWGVQVGLGVMVWLMARLSKQPSKNAGTMLVAGHIWNLAIVIGTIGILAGFGTGKHWMQFPSFLWPVLLLAYASIAIWVVITFRVRRSEETSISQWYLLAAALWFPWVYLTANLYVYVFDVQPLMATAINAWFRYAMIFLFFVPIAIASIYYILAKVTTKPIFNSTYSMAGFWSLAIIGPWAGMQTLMGAPIPVFLQFAGAAASVLVALPLLLTCVNVIKTLGCDSKKLKSTPSLRFSIAGTIGLILLAVCGLLLGHPVFLKVTQFSLSNYGFDILALYGCFSMVMFGAIYYIVPRITCREWLSAKLIRIHFWFSVYGTLFIVLFCILLGGFQLGAAQENYEQPWKAVVSTTVPFSLGTCLAWGVIFISNVFFLFHLGLMWIRLGLQSSFPTLLSQRAQLEKPADA